MAGGEDDENIEEFEEFGGGFEDEHFFTCPYCWQRISVVLDLSIDEQVYIEDCEVCCRPMQISYAAEEFKLISFSAESMEE